MGQPASVAARCYDATAGATWVAPKERGKTKGGKVKEGEGGKSEIIMIGRRRILGASAEDQEEGRKRVEEEDGREEALDVTAPGAIPGTMMRNGPTGSRGPRRVQTASNGASKDMSCLQVWRSLIKAC